MDIFMKTQTKTTPITSGFNPLRPRTDTRRIPFRSFLPAALLAAAALALGSAGIYRAVALNFPSTLSGTGDATFACFQVTVNPDFYWLMANPGGVGNTPSPGYAQPYLTSPGLGYLNTVIGQSVGYPDDQLSTIDNGSVAIGGGPAVGNPSVVPYTYTPPAGTIGALSYPAPFWLTAFGPDGNTSDNTYKSMLTEIQQFDLTSQFSGTPNCPSPTSSLLGPGFTTANPLEVKSGFGLIGKRDFGVVRTLLAKATYTAGTQCGFGVDYCNLAPCFPAKSFFDVFVEVTLPLVPNTESAMSTFPTVGAVLYNDTAHPLIVQNDYLLG